MKRGCSKGRRF